METMMSSPFFLTTGLAGSDAVLRGVQPGDNIVWQIQSLEAYQALVLRYAEGARRQQRRLIYFCFASHPPLLGEDAGAEVLSAAACGWLRCLCRPGAFGDRAGRAGNHVHLRLPSIFSRPGHHR